MEFDILEKEMKLPKILSSNYELKLIAFVLAIVTWWLIRGEITKETSYPIAVEVKIPENMILREQSAKEVEVTIRGPNEVIKGPRTEETITLDLTEEAKDIEKEKGTATIIKTIDEKNIPIPRRTKLVSHSPEKIKVTIDILVKRWLPIEVTTLGSPADGYSVDMTRTTARPSIYTFQLPRGELTEIRTIKTDPVNIAGKKANVKDRTYLVNPLTNEKLSDMVDVEVAIVPDMSEREFNNIPVKVMKTPENNKKIEITPSEINIKVKVRTDVLKTLDKSKINAYINITDQQLGEYTLIPIISPIEGLVPEEVPSVKVNILRTGGV